MAIIECLRGLFPRPLRNTLRRVGGFIGWDPWVNQSWSQEGEDMVLRRLFAGRRDGFYVDVGAHHPKRFSNTCFLYNEGWRGINIDAMPGSMKEFQKWRRRDINLELGVAQTAGFLDYFVFNEPALNGFSAELANERNSADNEYYIKEVLRIAVKPLRVILDQYLDGRTIDFLSVDVEGCDLDVLLSNDWAKYRPKVVLVELLASSLHDLHENPVARLMAGHGYDAYAKQVNTVFFKDNSLQ